MKAFRKFTLRLPLPERLAALDTLANNLRWSWHPPTQRLFEQIDPARWEATGDPLAVLADVDPARLTELAADDAFCHSLRVAAADLNAYLSGPTWFGERSASGEPTPSGIAYFSMEFGVTEVLPIYSGGLGILAGDHLKAASDLGLPLIGVGLFYRSGYFRQTLNHEGWQLERYQSNDPRVMPLELLGGDEPVTVRIPMSGGRTLSAWIWVARVGRIPLLLLDSDIPDNDAEFRRITDRLYGGDQDHRIKQEILLGIGGVRAVRDYVSLTGHAEPSVFHMNEGHAGFLGVERIRELVTGPAGLDFGAAEAVVRASNVFTTHTPVPAGIDRFPNDLVNYYLAPDHSGDSRLLPGLAVADILALGREADPATFNMAHMGFRLGQRANGVSALHGEVSRHMFADLWTGFDEDEVPIGSITNGVHGATWSAEAWHPYGRNRPAGPGDEHPELPSSEIWRIRNGLRAELVEMVRRRMRRSGQDRGFSEVELEWTDRIFDPAVLTIGFARRAATYKRLTLMLRDPQRLRRLLLDPHRPVQLVIAGKAHPADEAGKALIQEMVRFADDPELRHRIVFLPDYDMALAKYLYAGCDVWLNNPVRPMEACGTSGMKSALNGGLNLSIRDGWWDEMVDNENGWPIPSAVGVTDEVRRDDLEAEALYRLLEDTVIPLFYSGTETDPVPSRWVEMVRHTLFHLGPKVLASRMVAEYTTELYAPASQAFVQACADDYAVAKDLAGYRRRLAEHWPAVVLTGVDEVALPPAPDGDTALPGTELQIRAQVRLGGLSPAEVKVQAVLGPVAPGGEILDPLLAEMTPDPAAAGPDSAVTEFVATVQPARSGRLGYTARVLPRHEGLSADAELGLVCYPLHDGSSVADEPWPASAEDPRLADLR